MARKPFKIVNNLDLSGNNLIDVREIYRSDYDSTTPYLNVLIRAGNDKLGGSAYVGGDLLLYSGYGSTPGAIKLFIPNAAQSANNGAPSVTSEFGLKILGTTQTTLKTNSQQVTITTTAADINLQTGNSNSVVINSTNNGATTDKALEIAGGLYVGEDIYTAGDYFISNKATYYLLDSSDTSTAINFGGAVSTLNLGYDGNAKASTTNINVGTNGAYAKAVNIGTGGTAGTTVVTLGSNIGGTITALGAAINLGVSDNTLATTLTVGSAITGNTVKVAGTAAGTINYTTDVSTGIVNLFTSISTGGTVNLATAGASTTNIGGAAAKLYIGTSSGYIDTGSASSTAYVFNTNATTVNAFGAGTAIAIGADGSGTTTVRNSTVTFSKATAFNIDGVSPTIATTSTGTLTLFNTNLATVNAFGSAGTITIGNTITGAQTITVGGSSTATGSTYNVGTGATISGATKTVNIGTAGVSGSITNVNIGSTVSGATGSTTIGSTLVTIGNSGASTTATIVTASGVTTATIANTIATTVNFAGAATTLNIGNDTATTQIINIGGPSNSGVVNFNSTKDASSSTDGAIVVDGGVAIAKKLYVGTDSVFTGDLAVNGGDLTTSAATFNLLNANATTVNAFGAGTAITIGAATGTTTINNATVTLANATALNINGSGTITVAGSTATTANLLNTTQTTVNAFGAATSLNMGAATGTITIRNQTATFTNAHTINFGGHSTNVLTIAGTNASATTLGLFNTNQTTVNAFQAATTISVGATSGTFGIRNTTVNFDNATTFGATKLTTVNLGTAAGAATTFTLGQAGYNNTININGNNPSLVNGTSGSTANVFNTNVTTVNAFGAATVIDIGSNSATAVISLNSTKDASNSTDGGVAIDGGLSVAKRVYIGTNLNVDGSSTLGTDANDASTIRGTVTLTDSSASDPLTLGADVNLYRSAANVLTIDDSVTMTGLEFKGPATWNIGSTTDTLTIGKTSAQLTIKSDLTLEGTIKYLKFNTNPGDLSSLYTAGLMYYSNTDESLEYRPTANGVSISLGQETVLRAKNASATVAIPDGTPVYVSGGSGTVPLISPAKADASETAKVIGITTQTIAADGYGFVTTNGIVRAIDLTALGILTPTSGSMLYLSETTAGQYTLSPPAGTNYVVRLGWILDSATPTACNIFTLIGQSWTHTSTYNALRAVDVIFHDSLLLPVKATPAQSVEGQLVWNSTTHFLTAYNGSAIKTYVDTNSTQDLSNKTYNGLTVTENVVGFQIAGGTGTEKTFLLGMDLTVQIGKVVLTGNSGGSSQLTLPNANFTLNTAGGAGYAAYYSATGTLSGEQYLDVTRGGTGLGSFTDTAIITGGGTGDLKVPGATLTATALGAGSLTTVDIATSTTASTINIGSGAPTTGTKTVNIGTSSGTGSTTNVTIGSSLGTPNTYIYGNVTIGDAAAKVITLTGTVSSAGIKIFDSDSTTYTYTFAPGNIGANTTVTLPTTTGRYLTVGLRTDGLIDLKSVMAGTGSTALVPSAGGIVWTDANGFQILAGTSTAGKVLISGSSVTPAWSTGVLSLGTNFTTNTGTVTIVGNAANTSQLTLPAGNLTLPSSIVAGDLIYGNGSGTLTRLAAQTANYVLVSGASAPAWSTSPTITSMTLSNATGGLTFSGATSADIVTSSATTGNIFTTIATTINIGGTVASTTLNLLGSTATGVVNINSTKAATTYTDGALVVDGGVGIAGAVFTNSNATFAGDVAVNGGDLTSSATTFNLLNTTVTTLNILNTASSTLNVGSDNTSTRTMNVYADMNIGSATTARTINHYGQFNFGGPAGFTIVWNETANSIDFIKL